MLCEHAEMARTDPQINIRLPADLKARLDKAAAEAGRSFTAEIVLRLEESFPLLESALLIRQREQLASIAIEASRLRDREGELEYLLAELRVKFGINDVPSHPETSELWHELGEISQRLDVLERLQKELAVVVKTLEEAVRDAQGAKRARG